MIITLKKDSYRGVDGSSLSEDRCQQLVLLYDLSLKLSEKVVTYQKLQIQAEDERLFGETNAPSAIRTFAPLLSKLGFVNYEGSFRADQLFTSNGRLLIHTIRALDIATRMGDANIIASLLQTKKNIMRLGLHNMYLNPKFASHNMWIAIALLQYVGEVNWPEFGYMVYLIREQGYSLPEAIEKAEKNRETKVEYEYYKEAGTKLHSTFYCYIRAFLDEAGIAKDHGKRSVICDDVEDFMDLIKLDEYAAF